MVSQQNSETSSTATSIIPASTVNSDHNGTIIICHNNQEEPIYSESIYLDIGNILQKAKNLARRAIYRASRRSQKGHRNDYGRSQSVSEEQGSVNETQTDKLCHAEADNTVLPSNRAGTSTRSLSGHIKNQP
ncbi:hypothetical protein O181_026344 [Austropuccinia psidii MF-1]|uniref:Uncharacterized protein n=1 Tax=Austropuccinia psidii MF-1 TaxID=1389203 RepID=A0A9Q3CJS8_9BASI|nr:hypothetical protein [Austropuccinia psidii MF-1]